MGTKMASYPMKFDRTRWAVDVRRARKAADLTQAEVAAMLDLNHTSISGYENVTQWPLMSNYIAVCNLLDLRPDMYFSFAE